MAISNCLFSRTSENPRGFPVWCVLAKLTANPRNYSQPRPLCTITQLTQKKGKNVELNLRKTAINIKTEKWNEIISELRKRGWIVTAKYYGFDAGIDDDFLILRKGFKKILFGWTNWFEGEIKCNDRIFEYLETELKLEFEYGKPTSLKPLVISTYRIQSLPLFLVKKLNLLKS